MSAEHPDPSGELCIVDSLVQLSFHIQSILARVGTSYDLSVIQVRLLGILRDREPSMRQLAHHLGLDKSSVTGLIDRAERRGLVERIASVSDRRGFNVRVTDFGRELIEQGGAEIEQQILAAIEGLSEHERTTFIALAGKILGYSTA